MPIRLRALGFGLVACAMVAVLAIGSADRSGEVAAQPAASPPADEFGKTVVPFLAKYCNNCHSADSNSGGITLDVFESAAHAKKDRKTWEAVERVLLAGDMPPKKKKQPAAEERTAVVTYLSGTLLKVSCVGPKDPGRVTMRRLNRAEYKRNRRR